MQSALRLFHIYRVAARYRLGELLAPVPRARTLRWLLKLPFPRHPDLATLDRGTRLRLALEELGPIFIKFGQLLSTRRDMVSADLADALALLQDQVAPFDGAVAQRLIETALGGPITQHFKHFDSTPLASASVAQVHTATLHNGESVVVKVIRPGIDKVIADDVALLHRSAAIVEAHVSGGKRLRLCEVVRDYEHVIFDELNLLNEAANTTQLGRNFQHSPLLYVPTIYWDYCRTNVMVAERIHGIPVSRVAELRAAGINIKRLAETGVEIFFTQVFEHSFFHADMHPGNVYVSREQRDNPQYIALDCAIIGSLSKDDQQYLARNLLAIFKRDYRRVAELHVECGWVRPDTPVHAFESTMRAVCEPIFQKPLSDISFGQLLLQLFRTASRFDMQVQPSLVLLQKTLLNIEGLGKQLYPELDLWQTALPFLERWQARRLSPLSNFRKIRERLPEWLEQAPKLPELIYNALQEQSRGPVALRALQERTLELERRYRQSTHLCTALAAILGALLLFWVLR
ncbi:MAG: ubiquinone biosynthesis regulatory protein kinase UbiB [Pseudomonadales bacterium]|jgi:ubiquinone biosynthesis protein|nr:ubiquinone biosynthesis regulatory protein kinase UbiB [Pseudomonadales bacterium]